MEGRIDFSGILDGNVFAGSDVEITPTLTTGTKIADYEVDGVAGELYAPTGGGSTVEIEPTLSSGTKIADFEVDGVSGELYAPSGGGSTVEIEPTLSTGTKIADFEVDGVSGDLYAPTPISSYNSLTDKPTINNVTVQGNMTINEVPAFTASDDGKVLGVDNGVLSWTESGGSSDVEITPTLSTGTKIADFEVDGVSGSLYTPLSVNAVEKTQTEYNALTPAEKSNGNIYMVKKLSTLTYYDMTIGTELKQSSMSFTATESKVTSAWNGGNYIGGDWRFTQEIDFTNISKIGFKIKTRTCYGHTSANVEEQTTPRFVNTLYIFRNMPSAYGIDSESYALKYVKFKYTNTDYGDQVIDVSKIEGPGYIVWGSTGWNADLESLYLEDFIFNRIYFNDTEYANTIASGAPQYESGFGINIDFDTISAVHYKTGDTISITQNVVPSLVTNNKKSMVFNVDIGKPIDFNHIGSVSINYLTVYAYDATNDTTTTINVVSNGSTVAGFNVNLGMGPANPDNVRIEISTVDPYPALNVESNGTIMLETVTMTMTI